MSAERTFLHDLSSPLTGAMLSIENAIMILEDQAPSPETSECIEILNKSLAQIKRSSDLIHGRRQVLMEESEK